MDFKKLNKSLHEDYALSMYSMLLPGCMNFVNFVKLCLTIKGTEVHMNLIANKIRPMVTDFLAHSTLNGVLNGCFCNPSPTCYTTHPAHHLSYPTLAMRTRNYVATPEKCFEISEIQPVAS